MAKELLFRLTRKDFKVEAIRGSGNGGQHKNVTNSKCRITHEPSGAVATAQDERDYKQNEKTAFKRLVNSEKFKNWHRIECSRRLGILRDIDKKVEEEMKKIRVEVKDEQGRWKEASDNYEWQ